MKKTFYMMTLLTVFAACQKQPSPMDTDGEYLVYTEYDNDFSFSGAKTFYVPDSILVFGSGEQAEYQKTPFTDRISNAYIDKMKEKGYILTDDKNKADLGIQISYIATTHHYVDYGNPYWWSSYPGYWPPYYWGNWDYWGYPYPVHYSYTTNSLMGEILNLNADEGNDSRLPVVWSSYITGPHSSISQIDQNRFLNGINQAFAQSNYLGTK